MQPTNPEMDIQPTGKCEVWRDQPNYSSQAGKDRSSPHWYRNSLSPTNYATLPQVSDATRACIYTPDGKCVGMLSTKLYINLANAFHHARDSGYQNRVMPPPKDLNSELIGLLSYKKEFTSKVHQQISQKVKDTHVSLTWPHTSSTSSMGYGYQGQNSIWFKLWLFIQRGVEQKEKRYGVWMQFQSFSYSVHRLLGMPPSLRR